MTRFATPDNFQNSFKGQSVIAKEIVRCMFRSSEFKQLLEKQYLFNKKFYGMV